MVYIHFERSGVCITGWRVASDDVDVGVFQIVVGAKAGDGDCRCCAIAVRVVGEFASGAVVEQVVVRILRRFAFDELVGGKRPRL